MSTGLIILSVVVGCVFLILLGIIGFGIYVGVRSGRIKFPSWVPKMPTATPTWVAKIFGSKWLKTFLIVYGVIAMLWLLIGDTMAAIHTSNPYLLPLLPLAIIAISAADNGNEGTKKVGGVLKLVLTVLVLTALPYGMWWNTTKAVFNKNVAVVAGKPVGDKPLAIALSEKEWTLFLSSETESAGHREMLPPTKCCVVYKVELNGSTLSYAAESGGDKNPPPTVEVDGKIIKTSLRAGKLSGGDKIYVRTTTDGPKELLLKN